MSASPDAKSRTDVSLWTGLSPVQYAALATAFAVLGVSAIWRPMWSLWSMWTTDPLKSIGMAVPLVSTVLILRVWRALDWRARGTWWGLLPLIASMVLARIQEETVLILVVSPHWSTALPPPSLALLAYGCGVVLLLGGTRLFQAALFPIVLLWFANPIPNVFGLAVDLPLQEASAHIARAFAMHLGHPLSPDRLRLMFTPNFGMFIAPGCNGIRGSVTMGFIALIAGYIYRLRWYASAIVVIGGILLGYAFNLIRLCLLVLYYAVALRFTSLEDKAENADYLIGAVLFLLAAFLLFRSIHRLREFGDPIAFEATVDLHPGGIKGDTFRGRRARLAAMAATALVGCIGMLRAEATNPSTATIAHRDSERFPRRIGNYTMIRSWEETELAGQVVYVWAQYSAASGGAPIALGVSPAFRWHDPLICHSVRGENPLWHGQLTFQTSDVPISFSAAFYDDGVTRYLEASTQCSGATCSEFATERTHMGFIYSHPTPMALLGGNIGQPVPILLRVETTNMAIPPATARQLLTQDLRGFLVLAKLDDFARP